MNGIQIENLHKNFGAAEVLKGVSLSVNDGERVCVIGPSGSGKSTLARLVAGLEKPDQGQITVLGERVDGSLPDKRRADLMGMIFQHFNLFPHKTVLENLTLAPCRVKNTPRPEAEHKARELLSLVGLSGKEGAYPSSLSGGQQQRVAIARALCMTPKVMLFDEPTSALDPELVGEVLAVITRLAQEGMTMLIITHEMEFARRISDRIVFMADGKIIEQGPPDALLDSPREERTQLFLRHMNARRKGGVEA